MLDRIRVNGRDVVVDAEPMMPLGLVLHDSLGLRSVRLACGVGACGACTVLLDGTPVRSCLVPWTLLGSREILTNEGLADGDPIQETFVDHHAYQCGYCIPGMIMATRALLSTTPSPSADEVTAALSGNICRCGCYGAIRRAIADLVDRGPS